MRNQGPHQDGSHDPGTQGHGCRQRIPHRLSHPREREKSVEGQDLEQYVLLAYEGSNVTLSQRKDKRRKRTMTLQHMVDNCVPVEQGDYSINTCKNNPLAKEDYEQAAMSYARVAMHETLTECVGLQGGVSMSLYPFPKGASSRTKRSKSVPSSFSLSRRA